MSLNIQFLRDMLAQDSDAVTQLQTLLLQERALLEQRKPEGMQEIVGKKDELLSNLAFTAKQRTHLLSNAGLSTDLAGWIEFLSRDALTITLVPEWRALTHHFIECQTANEINGKLINRSKQTLTHLLNLLRGQVAAPSLYTQKGATSNSSHSHTVVKA